MSFLACEVAVVHTIKIPPIHIIVPYEIYCMQQFISHLSLV